MKEEYEDYEYVDEFNKCKKIIQDKPRMECLFKVLQRETILQDHIQLAIPSINESVALVTNQTNNVNALMIALSESKGDLRKVVASSYYNEKLKSLINGHNDLIHDFNITHKEKLKKLVTKEEDETDWSKTDQRPEAIKERKEYLFRGMI